MFNCITFIPISQPKNLAEKVKSYIEYLDYILAMKNNCFISFNDNIPSLIHVHIKYSGHSDSILGIQPGSPDHMTPFFPDSSAAVLVLGYRLHLVPKVLVHPKVVD